MGGGYFGSGYTNTFFGIYNGIAWDLYNYDSIGINLFNVHIAVDTNNVYWMSSGQNIGIFRWTSDSVTLYNSSNSNVISGGLSSIAIDNNNHLWTNNRQSFDGSNWTTFDNNGCYEGSHSIVFIDSENNIWITGTYLIGIETGFIHQPCVFRITEDSVYSFHINNGDNLPILSAGYHLINELSDGSILIFGRTIDGIEVKIYNGSGWDNLSNYNSSSSEVAKGFLDICIDGNDNILLAGYNESNSSQIAKYCNSDWNFYNLPDSNGFPSQIYSIFIDSQNRLWIAGSSLCSMDYSSSNCQTVNTSNLQISNFLKYKISNDYIEFINIENYEGIIDYKVFNLLGDRLLCGKAINKSICIRNIANGIYFLNLTTKTGKTESIKFFKQ